MSGDPGDKEPAHIRRKSDLFARVASSIVLVPIALFCAWWGSWAAFALVAAASAIVFAEWAFVVGRSVDLVPRRPDVILGAAFAALTALVAGAAGAVAGIGVAALGAAAVAVLSRSSWLTLGSLYAAALAIPVTTLRADPGLGFEALVVLLLLVWGNDSCAFFVGRSLGGPKLWPRISPKKTWSGSIGGLVGGVAVALAAAALFGITPSVGIVILLVMLSLASQAGDLFESAIKRHFHKKDSSGIIPGHGGMMDRIDGLVFAGAVAFLVGWAHGGSGSIAAGVLVW